VAKARRLSLGPGESFGRPAPLHPPAYAYSARAVETTVLRAYELANKGEAQ